MSNRQPAAYNRTSQIFHWVSALILIGMWGMGKIMVDAADSPLKTTMYRGHVVAGILITLITIGRIVWLLRSARPAPLAMPRWESLAFIWNHRLLYAAIVLLAFSGLAMLQLSGIGLNPAAVSPDLIQNVPPREGHELFSTLFLLLFLMHLGGVFYYQFSKGNTLGRMGVNWLGGRKA